MLFFEKFGAKVGHFLLSKKMNWSHYCACLVLVLTKQIIDSVQGYSSSLKDQI